MVTKWLIVASLLMVLVGVSLWATGCAEKTPPAPADVAAPPTPPPAVTPAANALTTPAATPPAAPPAQVPKHHAPAAQPPGTRPTAAASRQPLPKAAVIWTCPMHPQVQSDKPGKCPICGMDLVPKKTS